MICIYFIQLDITLQNSMIEFMAYILYILFFMQKKVQEVSPHIPSIKAFRHIFTQKDNICYILWCAAFYTTKSCQEGGKITFT